ncbi:hypothetical protein VJI72_08480, partial [Parvimonas micra]|uniref:hypothetical protein n=1 Tax=Parvimonas micra TaxID=33033 RepID=UPI002B465B8A
YSIQTLYELRSFYGGTRCHKVAIVDDIWDTGDTIKAIRHYIPLAQAFCMVRRGEPPMLESFEARNHFDGVVLDDTWVKFPWEAR